MEELAALLGSQNQKHDLLDKLVNLLDRQTDNKLSPNVMLGFMGMFNLLSIMSVLRGNLDSGMREVPYLAESQDTGSKTPSIQDTLSGVLKNQSGGQGGQTDLMNLLNNIAAKKKINPNLLLSLMSMLNSQAAQANSSNTIQSQDEPIKNQNIGVNEVPEEKQEKKTALDGFQPEQQRRAAGNF